MTTHRAAKAREDDASDADCAGVSVGLKLRQSSPRLNIILTSGRSQELFGRLLVLEHGHEFVLKPFQASELVAAVRRCLDS